MSNYYGIALVVIFLTSAFFTANDKPADTVIDQKRRRIQAEEFLKSFDYSPVEIDCILDNKKEKDHERNS